MPPLTLITESDSDPVIDTALSTALLRQVAEGTLGPTLRLFTPGRVMAFGSQDKTREGYDRAVTIAEESGFAPVERLAGGKAAVFHEGTLAFAWTMPAADPKQGIEQRFTLMASFVVAALASLGVPASIGEVEGEYCPGRFSVNVAGRKVMGVGQRLVKGAAHVGGVVVAHSPDVINAALIPTYEALGYDWDPAVTGAVGTEVGSVSAALRESFAAGGYRLEPGSLTDATRRLARDLAERHRPQIA